MICKRGLTTAAALGAVGAAGVLLTSGAAHAAARPDSALSAVETITVVPSLHAPVVHGPAGHHGNDGTHGTGGAGGVGGVVGGIGVVGGGTGGSGDDRHGIHTVTVGGTSDGVSSGGASSGGSSGDSSGGSAGVGSDDDGGGGNGGTDAPGAAVSGTPDLLAGSVAACDPVTGTAVITVDHTTAGPADVLLTVRFESGLPGPRLATYHFTGAGRRTFHVEWLPGGQYDVYLDATPPAADPVATVAVPHDACTVHATDSAEAVDASADVSTTPTPTGTATGGTLAHTGAGPTVDLLGAAVTALLLGTGAVFAARRRRAPRG